MRTDSISRRLATLEAKLSPKTSPHELRLLQCPTFIVMLDAHGVAVEDFKRKGLAALPRDLLGALAERLKVANAAG
ncbi:hypothetical protein [Dechloromonas denitrificans]|uniref:hypothetical protein n=1 Tax=Dechloromonas denitrificans TaxID=281362 RepID=UPI00082B6159|nr:hypothetical protein [Dechloromonas denitrificans]